jgi:D-glycero-alpha-D-manno-heptose 1-phosphate guanylyltransferase
MDRKAIFKNIDVLVLCGGQGTRIRSVVPDKPKILVNVGGKPFVDILLDNLASQGFRRVILAVGYMKEQIKKYFQANPPKNMLVEFSTEDRPLGTGGAVKKAKSFIKSEHFLVMNGDCFCPVDFRKFYESHLDKKTLLSMVLAKAADDSSDYGRVVLADTGGIMSFNEKIYNKENLISAGIYFMRKDVFDFMPPKDSFSLEYDFFPKILGFCYGFVSEGKFIDIGTPERYKKTVELFSK